MIRWCRGNGGLEHRVIDARAQREGLQNTVDHRVRQAVARVKSYQSLLEIAFPRLVGGRDGRTVGQFRFERPRRDGHAALVTAAGKDRDAAGRGDVAV